MTDPPLEPILSAAEVGERLGIARRTVLRYLWESHSGDRRYSSHPFPPPDGRLGKAPYWRAARVIEIDTWYRTRKGQGVGGGPKKKVT